MSTKRISELNPVVGLIPGALIEIEQAGNSFKATIQEALDLIIIANVGAGSGIFRDETPANTFNLKSIIATSPLAVAANADDLTLSISNIADADISATAAIAFSKMAALTANRAVVSDASGFIVVSAVTNVELALLSGATTLELQANKGAVSGYAGLDASQLLLLANFPSGTGLQVLRRNAGNTALEFATDSGSGVVSINADTTAAQILAGTASRISLVDAGDTHTFDIDAAYVGQASITTLGTITTGVWNATDIAIANIANGTANQIIKTNAGGTALEFGLIGDANTDTFTSTKITITAKGQLNSAIVYNDQANVFGDFDQTFKDNRILIESPDGLTPTTLINAQQTLARNLTIPILTGNRSIVVTTEASQIALGTEVTGASTDLTDTAVIGRSTDNLGFFAATTSAQLAGVISDETGTGLLVFGTSPTIVTPTIASFANAAHDHSDAAGGAQLLSTSALSDTADIAYLNTANVYTAGARQDFLGLLAGTAGLNVGAIAGNPTTQVDGDVWYNSSTNTLFGRINGANVDLGQSGSEVTTWTADHSTGGNAFILTDDASPPAGTVAAIYLEAGELNLNVAATNLHQLRINDVVEYSFSATQADFNSNNVINMGTLNTHTVPGGTSTFALFSDNLSVFAATTSAQLAGVISDETGSGALVFGTSPTIVTPTIASFVNATHDHSNAAGGGNLTNTALTSGVFTAITGLGVQSQALDMGGFNIDNIQNLIHDISTSGTDIDFDEDELQTISISTNTVFTTANRAAGRSKTLKITTDGTLRTLTFPGWDWVSAIPADQAASKNGYLTLTCYGTTDASIVAAYQVGSL